MPTINQLIKKSRVKPVARNKVPALERQPLKRNYSNLTKQTKYNSFGVDQKK